MGFTLSVPDRQYRLDSEAAQGPQIPTDPSMFQGTGSAVEKGAVGGLAATLRAIPAFVGITDPGPTEYEQTHQLNDAARAYIAERDKPSEFSANLQAVQDWAKADPSTQGAGARVLGSTTRGITILGTGSLFGGPIGGAATLGGVEGYNTYRDVQQGPNPVDEPTALKMAGVTGVASFAGAFLPMKLGSGVATNLAGLGMRAELAGNTALATTLFGTARAAATVTSSVAGRLGTAATVNTGFGAANRYFTSSILEDAGYKDMAAQYAPMDGEALTADFIMGLAFGGHTEIAPHIEALKERLLNGASVDALPTASMVEAALASRRQEMLARNGVGVPIDPARANLDTSLQDDALSNLLRGRDVSVSPDNARALTEGALPDPAKAAINDEFLASAEAQHGLLADFGELDHQPEVPRGTAPEGPQGVLREEGAPGEAAAAISPIADESMRQIAGANPDLPVDLGNGVSVRAADLPRILAEEMANANNDAKLHDVAMACFLRTQ